MRTAVIALNFGEPPEPDEEEVVAYLERIFLANAELEPDLSAGERRQRCRVLAERRAPGLLEEYREIGGSPLNAQARAQVAALQVELDRRGLDATAYSAMQFTEPFVPEVVDRARSEGADRVVGLPVYPLCGRSTTVAALEELAGAIRSAGWQPELREVSGWHPHAGYRTIRVEAIRGAVEGAGWQLSEAGTALLFSAHGTPLRYLEDGNRYEQYVREHCDAVARELGMESYELGYQNHGNRPGVEWTRPDVETVVERLDSERIVVDAPSFMHEQSETLAELDHDLRGEAEERGIEFLRVPVPHDDPRFPRVLADLVEGVLPESEAPEISLAPCRCRPTRATRCLNAAG